MGANHMAVVKEMKYKNVTIKVNDDSCQGVTVEEGAKILEKMINNTSVVRNGGGYVTVKHSSVE